MYGLTTAVLLAAEAKEPPLDFSFVGEPTLDAARKALPATAGRAALDSPLGRLLQTTLYGQGDVHGLDVDALRHLEVRKRSWWQRVRPNAGEAPSR